MSSEINDKIVYSIESFDIFTKFAWQYLILLQVQQLINCFFLQIINRFLHFRKNKKVLQFSLLLFV